MKTLSILIIILAIILAGVAVWYFAFYKSGNGNYSPGYSTTTNNSGQSTTTTSNILDLSNMGLDQIPSYVFNKVNLEELDVSHNHITGAIQAEIRYLVGLKVLRASDNQMTGVPAEIGQLSKLETLDLSNNQLTGLPYELGKLQNLKVLDLSGNPNYSSQDLDYIRSKLPSATQIITN